MLHQNTVLRTQNVSGNPVHSCESAFCKICHNRLRGLAGIGRATAFAYAREGTRVVASGRNNEIGAELVKQIREIGAEAEFFKADVSKEEEVKNLMDQTVKRFGRLDIAVNKPARR